MKETYATWEVTQLTGESKKDHLGRSPVIIRIYNPFIGKAKDLRTGVYCFPKELPGAITDLKPVTDKIDTIITKMRVNSQAFSFEAFERQYRSKGGSLGLVEFLIGCREDESLQSNKTAITDLIQCLHHSGIIKVVDGVPVSDIQFGEISYAWIKGFQTKTKKRGCNDNTVRFHLRTLRKYYNEAKRQGLAPQGDSPFVGINTQSLPSEEVKRYLTKAELKLFVATEYKSRDKRCRWREAKDIWLFSYLAFGVNLKDMLELRWNQVKGDTILISRGKTGAPLTLKVGKPLQQLMERYKDNPVYIFEHLRVEGSSTAKEKAHNNILGWVGDNVRRIAAQAGIPHSEQINFYSARHTFAVQYMENAKNPSLFNLMIYMGHKSETSTRNYLQSLIGSSEVKVMDFMDDFEL